MTTDRTLSAEPDIDGAPNQRPGQTIPWMHCRDFIDEASRLCVRINSRLLPPLFPGAIPVTEYSWELVRLTDAARGVSRFFGMRFSVKMGKASIDAFDAGSFCQLIGEAESWVEEQRQAREDKISEARGRRER